MNWITAKITRRIPGYGRGSSATSGAAIVIPLAIKLQIPIAVALL